MSFRTTARWASLGAAGALAATTLALAAPAAQAAPVFTDAETYLDPFTGANSYDYTGPDTCNNTYTPGGATANVPIVENGPAASVSTSATATYDNSGIAGDTATGSASATGTGKVTSVGGNLSAMDLTVNSSATLSNALGTSTECLRTVTAGVDLEFKFTVTTPGFLTLTTKNAGGVYGEAYLYREEAGNPDTLPYFEMYGTGSKFNGTLKVYLPAGTYSGYLEGEAYKYSRSSYAISGTTTVRGEFHAAGSQTAAVSGKGKKYVTLPGARSCATHTLPASVTAKKKRAAQVKQVTFFVNDAKVKKVKHPKKGAVVNVPVADDVTADVRAEVKLLPRKKGQHAKVVEVSSSYEACS